MGRRSAKTRQSPEHQSLVAGTDTRRLRDRQVVLRSETGATTFVLRRWHQMVAIAGIGAASVWIVAGTVGTAVFGLQAMHQAGEIDELQIGYAGLIAQLHDDRSRAADMRAHGADVDELALARRIEQLDHALGETRVTVAQLREERAVLRAELNARIEDLAHVRLGLAEESDRVADLETALEEATDAHAAALAVAGAAQRAYARSERDRIDEETQAARLAADVDRLSLAVTEAQRTAAALAADRDALQDELAARHLDLDETTDALERAERLLMVARDGALDLIQERDRALDGIGALTGRAELAERGEAAARQRIAALELGLELASANAMVLASGREMLIAERTELVGRTIRLEDTLVALHDAQDQLIDDLRDRVGAHVTGVEEALAFTGLDIDRLIAELGVESAAFGGPMIPTLPDYLLDYDGWTEVPAVLALGDRAAILQEVANALPIGAPVDAGVRLSSGFGTRVDPFTGRRSRHDGLDFAGPFQTPVYATSAGEVVYAGWRGAYGNLVEVRHAFGLTTRYAHLSSIDVEVGDQVSYGTLVGLLGSTGRSTGPHLHYEVRVAGGARDPMNFLRAGQHVFEISVRETSGED